VRGFLLKAVAAAHPDAVGEAARAFHITRQAVNRHMRALAADGLVRAIGATKGRRYEILRQEAARVFELKPGLEEHVVWRDFVRPFIGSVSEGALSICQYGFTEMFNNALEHSRGTKVGVDLSRSPVALTMGVQDDGVGIFHKIQESLGLEDERQAVLELSKGKLTTDPKGHSGEGVFFTSRAFDQFQILSGALYLAHTTENKDWLLETGEPVAGTHVEMEIGPESERTLSQVFDRFASADHEYRFSVTHVPVSLARLGEENLVSRSQARRLLARLDLFEEVVLDFEGVRSIGQAFADEVFRVFGREHPAIKLSWSGAGPDVEKMIARVRSGSQPPG
jgi:anti-sigma regulatory factor (Ser/Thr protein kinase)